MSVELRKYQRDAVEAVIADLGSRPVLVSPTGSGKTIMGVELVRRLAAQRPRTLWIAHRKELIEQAARQLTDLGLDCGIIKAGVRPRSASVQVASVQTLGRRETIQPADLIVIDEAHHVRAASYQRVLDSYPSASLVGLTATPFRLDGRGLGSAFGTIIVAATARQLCDDGTLIAPIVFGHPVDPLKGVRVQMGEFNMAQAFERLSNAKLVADIVSTWQRRAAGRRTVCFAINVEHSRQIVSRFRDAGITAEHLDGNADTVTRVRVLHQLRTGSISIVSNCMILTEGWDLPALEVAIVARPTASLCLHLQMLGRIMRAAPDKTGCIVLDHAGNTMRHGEVTQEIEYSLDDAQKVTTPAECPIKTCPSCYMVLPAATRQCPQCLHVFGGEAPEIPREAEGELEQLGTMASWDIRLAAWETFERQRQIYGHKDGWSAYRYKARFGVFPLTIEGRLVNPSAATFPDKMRIYNRLLATAQLHGYKPGWAGYRFKSMFGHWPARRAGA